MTAYSSVVRGESVSITKVSPTLSLSSSPRSESMAEQILVSNGPMSPVNNSDTGETQLDNSDGNVGPTGRPAWKRPSDGVDEIGFVMGGAASWPALSESTRPAKLSTDDTKPCGESISVSQGPILSQTSQKQVTSTANPGNNRYPARQRSMKRGSGVDTGSAQTNYNHQWQTPPPPPPFPVLAPPYGGVVPPGPEFSAAKTPYKGHNWENRPIGGFAPQSHVPFRNSYRRGNFNSRPRGGDHHGGGGGGGRRDFNHGHRGFRDFQVHQQMAPPMSFLGPPPPPYPAAHFVAPNHMRPFGNPMGFDVAYQFPYSMPPESFVGAPFMAPPPPFPVNYPVVNPDLPTLLMKQIEFYFSDNNIVKDIYLRSKMDVEGWVPISLIADFNRVKEMTKNIKLRNIELILDSLRTSELLEVQGDKVRRRVDWHKYLPVTIPVPAYLGEQSTGGGPNYSLLENAFEKVTLEEMTTSNSAPSIMNKDVPQVDVAAAAPGGVSHEELCSQVKQATEEEGARDN